MLDAEADEMCHAQRYEHSPDRVDTRAGSYKRKLHTKAGEVEVKVPKLRKHTFETAIIERYRRRDISIEEAIVQMYLAGVSVRRVEDVTEALWGTRVSSGTVSNLNKKVYKHIERWRTQKIEGDDAYVYLDGIVLKRSWGGDVKNVSVLAAIGVDSDGYRRILGVSEGYKEDKAGWLGFLKELKERGLTGVRLMISDACLGLVESIAEVFPDATGSAVPFTSTAMCSPMCPGARCGKSLPCSRRFTPRRTGKRPRSKSKDVIKKLQAMKLKAAAELVEGSIHETLAYYGYPPQHWLKIKTNNPMERLLKEARRRTKVVGAFPDGNSALMLVAARLRHVSSTHWGTRKYMNMKRLNEMDQEALYSVA